MKSDTFCSITEAEELCPGVTESRARIYATVNDLKRDSYSPQAVITSLIDCLVRVVDATDIDNDQREELINSFRDALMSTRNETEVKH